MYRTDCCAAHPVLLNRLSKVITSCGLGRQIFIYQWRAEVCGVQHIFMSDWRALMTPPAGHPGQLAYTFLIRILQTSFISVFNFLCLLLLQSIYLNGVVPLYRESVLDVTIQRKVWGRRRALSAALLHIFRKELLSAVSTLIHTFLAVQKSIPQKQPTRKKLFYSSFS